MGFPHSKTIIERELTGFKINDDDNQKEHLVKVALVELQDQDNRMILDVVDGGVTGDMKHIH